MISLKNVVFICAFLFISSKAESTNGQILNSSLIVNPDYDLTHPLLITKDNLFTHAICSKPSGHTRNCTVILKSFDNNNITYGNVCKSNFYAQKAEEGLNLLSLRAAHNHAVAFSYVDTVKFDYVHREAFQVYRVLNTSTCKFHEARIFTNLTGSNNAYAGLILMESNVILHDDGSFDVFVAFGNLCNGARCKVSYDSKGVQVGSASAFLPSNLTNYLIQPFAIDTKTSAENLFALVKPCDPDKIDSEETAEDLPNEVKLFYVTAHKEVQLVRLSNTKEKITVVDNSHGYFGICWWDSEIRKRIKCEQFDSTGNRKFSAEFNRTTNHLILNIHNLLGGGLAYAVTECKDDECSSYGHTYLEHVKSDGTFGKSQKLSELTCPNDTFWVRNSISHGDNDTVCVSIFCYGNFDDTKNGNIVNILRKCFSVDH